MLESVLQYFSVKLNACMIDCKICSFRDRVEKRVFLAHEYVKNIRIAEKCQNSQCTELLNSFDMLLT